MRLTSFIQTILLRDLLSYFAPGLFLIPGLALLADGNAAKIVLTFGSVLGDPSGSVAIIMLSVAAYAVGYINYSLMMRVRDFLGFGGHPNQINLPDSILHQVRHQIERVFGRQLMDVSWGQLAHICTNSLHILRPDIFNTMIERLISLRNFNVSVSGVLLLWSVILGIRLDGYFKLTALATLALSVFLLKKSGRLQDISRADSIRMFYLVL